MNMQVSLYTRYIYHARTHNQACVCRHGCRFSFLRYIAEWSNDRKCNSTGCCSQHDLLELQRVQPWSLVGSSVPQWSNGGNDRCNSKTKRCNFFQLRRFNGTAFVAFLCLSKMSVQVVKSIACKMRDKFCGAFFLGAMLAR
jgi:hypothetical protein